MEQFLDSMEHFWDSLDHFLIKYPKSLFDNGTVEPGRVGRYTIWYNCIFPKYLVPTLSRLFDRKSE